MNVVKNMFLQGEIEEEVYMMQSHHVRMEQTSIHGLHIEEAVSLHIKASPKSMAFEDHIVSSQHCLMDVKI